MRDCKGEFLYIFWNKTVLNWQASCEKLLGSYITRDIIGISSHLEYGTVLNWQTSCEKLGEHNSNAIQIPSDFFESSKF